MSLALLNYPSVLGFGTIASITNVMDSGAQQASWGIDQIDGSYQGSRLYTNVLRILTSSGYVGPVQIMENLIGLNIVLGQSYVFPIPEYGLNAKPGSFFPIEQDTGSFIQRIELTQDADDGRSWVARIEYGPYDIWHQLGNTNIAYGSILPTDMASIVRWSTAKYQRYYPTDVNGNPFINTCGDPLENPPFREESTQCLTIIQNEAQYIEPFAQSFRDTINSDTFLGFNPLMVKCKDIDGYRVYSADYGYYWPTKYEFEIRVIAVTAGGTTQLFGWQDLVLNAGFRAFGGATGVAGPLAPIVVGGVPVASPMQLNADGTCTVAAPGPPVALPQSYYLVFQNYPTSIFGNLNIDQDILTTNQ